MRSINSRAERIWLPYHVAPTHFDSVLDPDEAPARAGDSLLLSGDEVEELTRPFGFERATSLGEDGVKGRARVES